MRRNTDTTPWVQQEPPTLEGDRVVTAWLGLKEKREGSELTGCWPFLRTCSQQMEGGQKPAHAARAGLEEGVLSAACEALIQALEVPETQNTLKSDFTCSSWAH